jgi:hypothetical protein
VCFIGLGSLCLNVYFRIPVDDESAHPCIADHKQAIDELPADKLLADKPLVDDTLGVAGNYRALGQCPSIHLCRDHIRRMRYGARS